MCRKQSVHAPGLSKHRSALDASGDFIWETEVNKQQRSFKQHWPGDSTKTFPVSLFNGKLKVHFFISVLNSLRKKKTPYAL